MVARTERQCHVIAVLGKGGVGKTALSALITKTILNQNLGPLLAVDADPAGGLTYALGCRTQRTIADVKEGVIGSARNQKVNPAEVADTIDWRVLECLHEFDHHAVLAMGHPDAKGCFCPVNTLLRAAIEKLASGFRFLLLDAEAGIEQVNRQVVRSIHQAVIVTDGSWRGLRVVATLSELLDRYGHDQNPPGVVLNRNDELAGELPSPCRFWGSIPDDAALQDFDAKGRSLLGLPDDNPAVTAVRQLVDQHLTLSTN